MVTADEGGVALAVVAVVADAGEIDERELNPRQIAFALEYVSGEHSGNATACYQKVYGVTSENTASSNGSRLLANAKVKELIARIHQEAIQGSVNQLMSWADLLPSAQAVILATLQGRLRNRLSYEAAVYLCNRVMGAPTATLDVQLHNRQHIVGAMKTFLARVSAMKRNATMEDK